MSRSVETPPAPLGLTVAQEAGRRVLVRYASDGLVLLDCFGEVVEVGLSYPRVLGYTPGRRREMRTAELIHPGDLDGWRQAWSELMTRPGKRKSVALRARHTDGRWCSMEVTLFNGLDDPEVNGVVAATRNLSRRDGDLETEDAERGALEFPPDRAGLLARLGSTLARLPASAQMLVVVVKLDQLHLVARACGRDRAAQLLREVEGRLRRDLPGCDDLGVVDHDRRVLVCETHGGKRAANALAKRVAACLSEPFRVGNELVVLTASVGIAVAGDRGDRPATLLEDADLAMAVASTAGGNRRVLFSPSERSDALRQVTLPTALRRALRDEKFVVHYQPVVQLSTGEHVGAEALVRWRQADGTLAGPESFIGAAEISGVIVPLGTWVLQEACRTAARWPAGPTSVAVNLSSHQLADPKLPGVVKKALSDAGLEPSRLTLEVTESVFVAGPEVVIGRLQALRELGVKVAIDDFGTGWSSLAYLKRIPFDVLKIDRSFVTDLGKDKIDTGIVTAVIMLAQALGLDVVAEGVETEVQAAELVRLGCPYAQGYLYSRPTTGDRLAGPLAPTGLAT